jgi:hypothetical protein
MCSQNNDAQSFYKIKHIVTFAICPSRTMSQNVQKTTKIDEDRKHNTLVKQNKKLH